LRVARLKFKLAEVALPELVLVPVDAATDNGGEVVPCRTCGGEVCIGDVLSFSSQRDLPLGDGMLSGSLTNR